MASFLESSVDRFFDLSPQLQDIYIAISIAARPLHSKEIVEVLKRLKGEDYWEGGKTPEKTVNARISEHIQNYSDQVFFRTGPNIFYHRPINESARFDSQYEENWHKPRVKTITDEFVLVAPKDRVEKVIYGSFVPVNFVDMNFLEEGLCYFMPRSSAERDTSVKQFVSYSLVRSAEKCLIYRRGKWSNPSGNLFRKWSIAFGGHVSDEDLTLFDNFKDCFVNNSSREVREELKLFDSIPDVKTLNEASKLTGFINVDDNSDARQHIAAVVEVELDIEVIPQIVESEITQLQWCTMIEIRENREYFDLWSRLLIDRLEVV